MVRSGSARFRAQECQENTPGVSGINMMVSQLETTLENHWVLSGSHAVVQRQLMMTTKNHMKIQAKFQSPSEPLDTIRPPHRITALSELEIIARPS